MLDFILRLLLTEILPQSTATVLQPKYVAKRLIGYAFITNKKVEKFFEEVLQKTDSVFNTLKRLVSKGNEHQLSSL